MYFYSKRSRNRLNTCCTDLIRLFTKVIKYRDCTVLCGYRGKADQDKAVEEKRSKTKYPHSKHNQSPSQGIDVAPYPIPKNWGRISWKLIPKKHRRQIEEEIKELCEFYNFNGFVKGVADCNDIPIRQGHDWDGDNEFNDQSFDDIIHTEAV